jgi:hypothetical protein
MARETWVYRPQHPQANENGFVSRETAEPIRRSDAAPMIISDIAPYRSVATDIATGKPVVIGGRRQHREFLQRNGYTEVGNDYVAPRREELSREDRVSDIKRILEK